MWRTSSAIAGSSPLTRGKPRPPRVGLGISRLIPAHAGKTWSPRAPTTATWAHPRSRGENLGMSHATERSTGSSPLTRGKRYRGCRRFRAWRLIPAHAGKTGLRREGVIRSWAHPRSRGENQAGRRSGRLQLGSSPLTRGKPGVAMTATKGCGLIPAHAGKTHAHPCGPARKRAHPRSRGENTS